ncbi:sporulation histidine kinase inhibitor Sda [Paenibacillus flagellatus]|uniref:Sporulation histidine kinase inhibitor Sda n=1 Tax=Paenibacillus flagellatus TaxID=2211139 RepID=A0A2V5KW41_9BACL|nr:sporulation histidine kinase inhibitor Sda [Paenibacillus flagellatus]PYI53856.1 sporulation histidine kinase inhibitor Sda [Paenibacillus flagellatus]
MNQLKDDHLLDCYEKSLEWKLDDDFIQILREEIEKRQLELPERHRRLETVAAS